MTRIKSELSEYFNSEHSDEFEDWDRFLPSFQISNK